MKKKLNKRLKYFLKNKRFKVINNIKQLKVYNSKSIVNEIMKKVMQINKYDCLELMSLILFLSYK